MTLLSIIAVKIWTIFVQFRLQEDLDKIGDWLSANRLCGNALKSVSILVGSKRRVKDLSF